MNADERRPESNPQIAQIPGTDYHRDTENHRGRREREGESTDVPTSVRASEAVLRMQ
jgi:hypothetical protein